MLSINWRFKWLRPLAGCHLSSVHEPRRRLSECRCSSAPTGQLDSGSLRDTEPMRRDAPPNKRLKLAARVD